MRLTVPAMALLLHSFCVSAEPADPNSAALSDYSAPYDDYSADDPYGDFDIERAAQFIDNAAVKWGVKHECVTCHTNGHYLMVPPELFKHRPAATEVRDFAEGWIDSWADEGLPRTEIVVAPSAFLTINNMQMDGELRPATIDALQETWSLQSEEGHWPDWLKCEWPPFEQDDHYGVTLLTIAMGMAPESYKSVDPAKTGIQRMLNYLQHHKPEEVHHRAMMLWVDRYYDDLVSAEDRERWIDELLALQKASGGWASGDLGRWRQRAPETGGYTHLDPDFVEREYPPVMIDPNGDGYGTGFVLHALLQAGVPTSHDQIQKGVAWLKRNQQADGKWFTNSLRNEYDTSNFLTHTGTVFALMVLAETM
jgi:squalene-hopene/tetraprenyl-beta-curcumene cyclase